MQHTRAPRLGTRDRLAVAGLALAAVLCATPGVHLAERWLRHGPAVLVSHGLAVLGLALAAAQWRARRARTAAGPRAG